MRIIRKHARHTTRLFLTGFAMGTADTVPGVSGGTIAFIFGVYEELVYTIKKLSGETLKLVVQGKVKQAFAGIPFHFLISLGLGLVFAIVTLARLVEFLLENQPVFIWSFFFGLLVASIFIVRKRVVTWDRHDLVALAGAAVFAYLLSGIVPVQTPATILAFFLAGMVAIIAMILPGVSGSFLLILMGKYEQVLGAVNERNIIVLLAVALGAVIGLGVFSRVLSWLFEKHHDITVATLTGFMIGSLRKVWPWKNLQGSVEINVLPSGLDAEFYFSMMLMILAVVVMVYLDRLHVTKEKVSDIDDVKFVSKHKKSIRSERR